MPVAMRLFDKFKALLGPGRVDIAQRYEILDQESSGTMSRFYKARDRDTGKTVGLKILDREKMAQFNGRFKGLDKPSEGEIGSSISHPRIVKTLEYGETSGKEHYVLMEYLEGTLLSQLINEQAHKLQGNRVNIVRQMAEAVGVVHKAGYIHRDVCPRNFIYNHDLDSVRLIDFGLSLPCQREYMLPGNRTGTPHYMSPEVVRRRPTDQRLDIFSLGVSAYQVCTQELPWPAKDASGMAALSHDTVEPVSILERCPNLNRKLAETISRCLRSNPDERPQTIAEFLNDIRSVKSDEAD